MLRFMLLTLLNISLPFILRAIYIYALRVRSRRQARKGMKNVTPPPEWHFPVRRLLMIGVLLLFLSLLAYRMFGIDVDAPFAGNPVQSGPALPGKSR